MNSRAQWKNETYTGDLQKLTHNESSVSLLSCVEQTSYFSGVWEEKQYKLCVTTADC